MEGSLGSNWGWGNRLGVWLLLVDNQHLGGSHPGSQEVPCQGLGCQGEACEVHCRKARYNCWADNLRASFVPGARRLLALGVLPFSFLDAVGGQGVHRVHLGVHLACRPC